MIRESFKDFCISNPHSSKPLPVALTSSPAPAVPAWKPFGHSLHLSALGGESPKPIQEVVTTWTALEGEPSTLKMVMMPAYSSHDLIRSTDPSQAYPDKTKSIVHVPDVLQCKSSNCCVMVDLDDGSTKFLPTIATDDPGVAWDPTATIADDDPDFIPHDIPGPHDVPGIVFGLDQILCSVNLTHADPHGDQDLVHAELPGEKDPNAAPPDPAPDEDANTQTLVGTNDGIPCTSSFIQESDSPQFYGSLLSDYIRD